MFYKKFTVTMMRICNDVAIPFKSMKIDHVLIKLFCLYWQRFSDRVNVLVVSYIRIFYATQPNNSTTKESESK